MFALLIICISALSTTAQSPAHGVWNFSMESPMGSVSAIVTINVGEDVLTGEFDLGGGRTWLIEDGTIDGNIISFNINRDGSSMTYIMTAQIEGNSMTGVAAAMGTTAGWSMIRAE